MDDSNQSKGSMSLNEILYRRLKNRERQRRYREKKRLKAVSSKASITNQSSQLQIVPLPLPTNGTVEQVVTHVHCGRDWKKDARRLHGPKQDSCCALSSNDQYSTSENVHPGVHDAEQILKIEVLSGNGCRLDDHEKVRSKPGRRDWKAEARKNSRNS